MDTCHVKRQNMSHIVIDLGRTSAGPALVALGHRKKRRKVKSALIMAQQAKSYIPWHRTDRNHVKTMLQALGDLPNLTVLTVDLSYWKLRVVTLTVMLQATKTLRELSLKNLVLTGNLCDHKELEHVLESHSNIQNLNLDRCQGTATVRTLLTKISSLRKVKICSSRINQSDVWASITLVELLSSNPRLRSLSLQDVLDLEDRHICQLVEALRSKSAPLLQELYLSSPTCGQMAGEAIFSLLRDNDACISKLTLNLGGSWNSLGTYLGSVLSSNTTLHKLQLRLTGRDRDVASKAIEIASALSDSPNRLSHLGLAVDLIPVPASIQFQEIVHAFESALKTNHNLEDLRLCGSRGNCARSAFASCNQNMLSPFLKMKLDLNRSGILTLLHTAKGQSIPMDRYLKAMARANDNLSVLFYALHNNPALFRGQAASGHRSACPYSLALFNPSQE